MWGILKTDQYLRRYKRYDKKKKNELNAVLNNLDIFLVSLRSGKKPKPLIYGFLHGEPSDVIAIDQTGGQKLAATRLLPRRGNGDPLPPDARGQVDPRS